MLGLGKWQFEISTFLFTGTVTVDIRDNNGNYEFELNVEGFNEPINYELIECKVKGNTLYCTARASLVPGNKIINSSLTFDGDKCSAVVDLPFMGKLTLDNGKRI